MKDHVEAFNVGKASCGPCTYGKPADLRLAVRVLTNGGEATTSSQRPLHHESHGHSTVDNNPARPVATTSHPAPNHTSFAAMLVLFSLLTLLGTLSSFTSATALTYKLTPNEKECFYTHVVKQGAKVAFYFAVQSGGSFDSALRPTRTFQWHGSADHK